MTKKILDQNMSYKEELLNSIEPNFIFSKKPINRFKSQRAEKDNKNLETPMDRYLLLYIQSKLLQHLYFYIGNSLFGLNYLLK